jgi:glycolate oxidase iron-sulfur subunit
LTTFDRLRAAAERCVACAACRSGCPTFDATLEEGRSGRGRVHLVRAAFEGALAPSTDRFAELLSSCTRCGFCAKICPVGIPVVEVIDAGRAAVAEARGVGVRARVVLALLRRPKILRAALAGVAALQRLLFAPSDRPRPFLGLGRGKPIFRLRFRRAKKGSRGPADGPPISLRVGCRTDALTPEAADDAAYLLARAGLRVVVPKGQSCGGAFATACGAVDDAAALAAKSRELFERSGGGVASMCGACDATPSAHGGEDWTIALERKGFVGPFDPSRLKGPVVVQDACVARFGSGGGSAALRLLRSAGVDARPFEGVACCGGSAPFSLDARALSERLGRDAASAAKKATGRGTFVASDAGCLLQFASFASEPRGAVPLETSHVATALRRLVDPAR